MEKLLVAAIQYEPAMFAYEVNREELYHLTEKAAASGAKIIVLPEMATTGYGWSNRWELAPYVETIPGPTTELFSKITREYGCYVVIGLAEVDPVTGIYYNAAALVGPNGLVGRYRKTHLFVADPRWAAVGDLGFPVWETEFGRLGIAICLDLEFPEVARVLALKGAQIIAFPCNWLGEVCPSGIWMTRALENEVCLVAANRWGRERGVKFSGGSCVIGPQGNILAFRGNGNGVVAAELSIRLTKSVPEPASSVTESNQEPERQMDQQTDEQKELQLREESASSTRLEHKQLEPLDGSFRLPGDYLMRRRPDLYHQLMCAGHLWRPETFFGLDRHSPLPEGRESLVGLIQFEAVPGNRDANLTRIQQWVTRAKQEQPGLQLLVFPELANTGLVTNKMSELAESIPGATSTFLSQVAVEHAIYLAWGMAERGEDGSVYITAVLAGPDGRIYTYRKVHLLARDEVWAQRGSALPMPIDTSLGRIGLLLGTDLLFPEAARCLANQGVDLIVVPAALAGPGPVGLSPEQNLEICSAKINDPYHWSVWRVRAWENSVYLIVANKAGKGEVRRGLNLSGIFGPIAYERSEAAQEILTDSMEGMLVKTISTSRTTREGRRVRAKDNLRRRQIGLYRELVLQG